MSLEIDLLEQSFVRVRDRQTEFTDYFYSTLFANYPAVKPLFANTHMEQQSTKLFASLVVVVDSLRTPEKLAPALMGLGTRHVKYGALPAHYPAVGGTLIKSFAFILQDDWTPEFQQAWADAYAAVTKIMLDGANYPPEILTPEA